MEQVYIILGVYYSKERFTAETQSTLPGQKTPRTRRKAEVKRQKRKDKRH
jgi:hypothetical protein